MAGVRPHFIVFANEKGGTGKSTTAVHSAVALAAAGRKVAAIDLDTRQRTLGRYLDNRLATIRRTDTPLPMPAFETFDPEKDDDLDAQLDRLAADAEIVVVDTPGRDDPYARHVMLRADTLVTPINDSFVDLDLIGQVDPETYKIRRPSFYASSSGTAARSAPRPPAPASIGCCSEPPQHVEAKNMRRVGLALDELSTRVGFRVIPGLGERVIYRELFPKGLTLLDLEGARQCRPQPHRRPPGASRMIAGFGLPSESRDASRRARPMAG
jgi:chromosome partitioning protein